MIEDDVRTVLSAAAIEAATESEKVAHSNEHDFFRTGRTLAETACHRLGYKPGHRLLEPSVGEADLIAPLLDWHGRPALGDLVLYEKDPRRFPALTRKGLEKYLVAADFLEANPTGLFDRVVMNPPFHRGADTKHIARALDFLAPGGRLVAIASAGLKSRSDKETSYLRDQIIDGWGGSIEALPAGSFRESGTDVNTVLVCVDFKPVFQSGTPPAERVQMELLGGRP